MLAMNKYLIAAAVLPAVLLLVFVYKADKKDKEPFDMLLSLVLLGVVATTLAMTTERIGAFILNKYVAENTVRYNLIMYFGIVAVSEEGFKYLFLKKRTWRSKDFDYQFDAVVYAVFITLGFALWENIGYVFMYGMNTAFIRAVTAVPGHACFGVFMGAWYGFAKRLHVHGKYALSKFCRILAFLFPTIFHGAYDFIATIGNGDLTLVFVGFVALMFIVALILVKKLSKNDHSVYGR